MTPEQRAFLLSLDRDGETRPDDVVAAAEPPDSPIHGLFMWDNEAAGHRYRLDQARQLIRSVRVNVIPAEKKVREFHISEYVRTPLLARDEQGYTRLGLLAQRPKDAAAALEAELEQVRGRVQRVRAMAHRLGLEAECERELTALLQSEPNRQRGLRKTS